MAGGCNKQARALILLAVALFGLQYSTLVLAASDPDETAALQAFKAGVRDGQDNLKSWSGNDPCSSWRGITCGYVSPTGVRHVTEMTLPRLNLGGTLAPELGNLTQLKVLNLKYNNIQGGIPPAYGKLNNLWRLLVNDNRLSGELPPELGSLSALRRFQIDTNGFSGPIPATFGNLSNCLHMHLTNNSLSGPIPSGLLQLPNLLHLLLDSNQLGGPLPPAPLGVIHLNIIQLDNNNFGAPIPSSWGLMTSLHKLSLANCSLQGTIPDLSKLSNLTYLDLSNNSLTGFLPVNLTAGMLYINLANNVLSGPIPATYGYLDNIQALKLQNNNLSGGVPETLGTGTSFFDNQTKVVINLESNRLEGLVGTALPDAIRGPDHCEVWLAGNTVLCNMLDATTKIEVHCDEYSNNTFVYANALPPPGNHTEVCSRTLSCAVPSYVAPNSADCHCAEPLTLFIVLISPPFAYLSENLTNQYLQFLNEVCGFPGNSGMAVLQSAQWLPEPIRLQTTVLLFPPAGDQWNQTEMDQLQQNLTNFNLQSDDLETDPDYFVIGPYEAMLVFAALSSSKGMRAEVVAAIAVGCAVAATAITAIALVLCLRKYGCLVAPSRLSKQRMKSKRVPPRLKIAGVKAFTLSEMAAATNGFQNDLGEGSYGKVYKGMLEDGRVVAIKRAHDGQVQGSDAFYTEIELLSRVHHKNLVELIGFCDDCGEQMLVYEFMPEGTLRDHLIPTEVMHFVTRMRIALATARGILYLHCDANPPIFHRDIKTSNILLDDHFNAKVADFGLSRLAPMPNLAGLAVNHHVSTVVKGTPGYLDPEYFLTQKLTDKSDVYSFGVVLMELISGLQPIYNGKNLVREVISAYEKGKVEDMVDPYMPSYPPKALELLAALAIDCCRDDQASRPSMTEVVRKLEDIACMIEPWSIPVRDFERAINTEDGILPPSDPQSSHVSTENARSYMLRESLASLGGR